jgi:hypothetical protein
VAEVEKPAARDETAAVAGGRSRHAATEVGRGMDERRGAVGEEGGRGGSAALSRSFSACCDSLEKISRKKKRIVKSPEGQRRRKGRR